jgi:hypothetical protein
MPLLDTHPKPDTWTTLVAQLKTTDVKKQSEAAFELAHGDRPVPATIISSLEDALDHPSPRVLAVILTTLGRAAFEDATARLHSPDRIRELSAHPDKRVAFAATNLLTVMERRRDAHPDPLELFAPPTTPNEFDALTLRSPRVRSDRVVLRQKAATGELNLAEHSLVQRLRQLGTPGSPSTLDEVQAVFRSLEGLSFGSLENHRQVCSLIQAVLRTFRRKLCCTECGRQAGLTVLRGRQPEVGSFQFDHGRHVSEEHRSRFHGGVNHVPRLLLFSPTTQN